MTYPSREDHVVLAELLLRDGGRSAFSGSSAFRVDFAWGVEVDATTTMGAAPRRPVDRHTHGWSKVAHVRRVDMRLAA